MSRKGCEAPPGLSFAAHIAGAALRPFRDTRPLPQRPHMPEEVAVPVGAGLPAKRPGQTNAASKSCANACCASPPGADLEHGLLTLRGSVGAALCRERGAKRPQDLASQHISPGPLCGPFATQGRSHRDRTCLRKSRSLWERASPRRGRVRQTPPANPVQTPAVPRQPPAPGAWPG